MSSCSSTENENAAYRGSSLGTPFPLMGKGRDRGAREPKGKDEDAVVVDFFTSGQRMTQLQFSKEGSINLQEV
jgi:hypothetical protein